MSRVALRVGLVAPHPPGPGGIIQWTKMISAYAATRADVRLYMADTTPRWRAFLDLARWKRVFGGGLQLIKDCIRVLTLMYSHPDVLHITTSGQLGTIRDLMVMTVARLYSVPVVYHIHFGRIPQLAGSSSLEWQLIARAMRMAHTVIAIDNATVATIRRYMPKTSAVQIPNCIDLSTLPKSSAGVYCERTVLFLGSIHRSKGIEELIEAWSTLQPPGWRLRIVGPSDTEYQRKLFAKYQPQGVEFLGEKPHCEALRLMAEANAFVLPSHTEGFPNVVLEAMALGKAILATRVGAIPEMLGEKCGLLVNAQDTIGLRNALEKLIADEDLRKLIGSRSLERVQSFSVDKVFARYMAVWRNVAGSKLREKL